MAIVDAHNELSADRRIVVSGLPDPAAIVENGFGRYLAAPGD
jgi:hypothetical protein